METGSSMKIATKCVHSGVKHYEFGPIVPPIYQTSTFAFRDADHGARLFKGEEEGFIYTRMRNPTIEALEDAVAELEFGTKSIACASGMAAISLVIFSTTKSGDHIISGKSVYGPITTLLGQIFSSYGLEVSFVDTSNIEEVKNSFRSNTKLIFFETPGNPTLLISDIQVISKIAHTFGAKVVVDNTFMTPVLQNPLKLGADIVVHSMTKYLNGHADVVAGIVVFKDENDYLHFRKFSNHIGGVIDPFNAFLVHRGLKTLYLRMERHCSNALQVAKFLEQHPKVEKVWYPYLESHPQYELARKQSLGGGGMISIELKGGLSAGKALMNNISVWKLAVSLGGVESLIQHPASMTHSSMTPQLRAEAGITEGLVRLSVGIEDPEDLINGLEKGLSSIE
ncbi:MAG: PLP-dependent aspartate aminotransferase family protein [Ignavibacteria bacterium]|nr:PLP-dependent aspartate aminotransferase family protein [Ignavibacteria bacterium]